MRRSIAPFSTWAASYLRPSSVAFITIIAESSFQHTQATKSRVCVSTAKIENLRHQFNSSPTRSLF
jgi:hypothetical protein